jgi:hypothetical protein
MNTSKSYLALVILTLTFFASPLVQAAVAVSDDEEEMGYEDIVKDLSKEQRRAVDSSTRAAVRKSGPQTSIDDVMIHGGVGFTQMFGTVKYGGDRAHLSQRGIQATLGIDLFSENWLAEGSARNFSSYDYGKTNVALKEFDLKIVYHNKFAPKLGLRLGGGLAARYMQISNQTSTNDYTTPASVFTGGVELLAAQNLTFAAEMSARTALISETLDKNSYDMTFRIDANF